MMEKYMTVQLSVGGRTFPVKGPVEVIEALKAEMKEKHGIRDKADMATEVAEFIKERVGEDTALLYETLKTALLLLGRHWDIKSY